MSFVSDHTLAARALAVVKRAIRRAKTLTLGQVPTHRKSDREAIECKEIVYRGGIVRFKIPRHWIEEYEPAGGATFYEDHPDASILRLQIVGFESQELVTVDSAIDALTTTAELGFSDVVVTPEGNAVARKFKRTIDDGEAISMYFWAVANPIAPRSLRIAHFTFTVLTVLEDTAETLRDLALLNDSIEHAEFHPEAGISGDYYHDRQ